MNRAAVLVGVRKIDGLSLLNAVWDGVAKMECWARTQGLPSESIRVLTDQNGPVSALDLLEAIKCFVNSLTIDQLIIYYSGHGLNLGQSEYWLLSGFPSDATTVVNLTASTELARHSTIPHVIFISDACRTAACSIVDQLVLKNCLPIFPSPNASTVGGKSKWVDVFYATALGRPALEIHESIGPPGFHSIYTEALVDALNGLPPISPEPEPTIGKSVIRPWPLSDYLDEEVPRRLIKINPVNPPSQIPNAEISSRPSAWLSVVDVSQLPQPPSDAPQTPISTEIHLDSPPKFSQIALKKVLDHSLVDLKGMLIDTIAETSNITEAIRSFEATAIESARPFGYTLFETKCGFKVQGTRFREAISCHADVEILSGEEDTCRVAFKDGHRFANVLLIFQTGQSVVLPAITEYITGLTFDPGVNELIDVCYEPSENSSRWDGFQQRQDKLRNLRAIVSASTRMGTFKLKGKNAWKVARDMQINKGIDPSLSIYVAYAYRKQGHQDRIKEMYRSQIEDIDLAFFDVAMLSGELPENTLSSVLPPVPLLNQGWALLDTFEVKLPMGLENIRQYVDFNSLWTLYKAEGADLLKNFISSTRG